MTVKITKFVLLLGDGRGGERVVPLRTKDIESAKTAARILGRRGAVLLDGETGEAILTVDTAGYIVLANPGADAMFGYERGGLVGQRLDVLVPERVRVVHEAHRAQYFDRPHPRPLGRDQPGAPGNSGQSQRGDEPAL